MTRPPFTGAPCPRCGAVLSVTPVQERVIALIAEGLHDSEIAERLGMNGRHAVRSALAALGAARRPEGVDTAVRTGLLGPPGRPAPRPWPPAQPRPAMRDAADGPGEHR
ncbi:hypothetical protein [Kitasatospora purpeofusca]|uniref:hypothetical protein n=1 Tax=Kitasatospora purpeofusca TaxID=67352 RepID=UPI00386E5F47|nr:hypothetical protein OIP63_39290 [Kitasatospora purpeofusca]